MTPSHSEGHAAGGHFELIDVVLRLLQVHTTQLTAANAGQQPEAPTSPQRRNPKRERKGGGGGGGGGFDAMLPPEMRQQIEKAEKDAANVQAELKDGAWYRKLIKDAQASLEAVEKKIDKDHPGLEQYAMRMKIIVHVDAVEKLMSR